VALSRVKTWTAEVLTHTALNAEFNNILNNALNLISPLTGNLDAGNNLIQNIGAAGTDFLSGGGLRLAKALHLTETTAPTTSANEGALYTKESSSASELFFREESSGDEVQITKAGAVNAGGVNANGLAGFDPSHATDTAHDITFAAGSARAHTDDMTIAVAAITKRIDAAWAVGTGNGALDTGSVGTSALYRAYAIKRVDTGVTDMIFSLQTNEATGPAMPTNYTKFAGTQVYVFTDGSSDIRQMVWGAGGWMAMYKDPVQDVDAVNPTAATDVNAAISVPPNSLAYISFGLRVTQSSPAGPEGAGFQHPDVTIDTDEGNSPETVYGWNNAPVQNQTVNFRTIHLTDTDRDLDYWVFRKSSNTARVKVYTFGWMITGGLKT